MAPEAAGRADTAPAQFLCPREVTAFKLGLAEAERARIKPVLMESIVFLILGELHLQLPAGAAEVEVTMAAWRD